MQSTLFLYLDILGFADLVEKAGKVERLFEILDSAALHKDANYKVIVFSDTVLAYNAHDSLTGTVKATELMFLIELVQDLLLRLIGTGIFFRAVITEGEFNHSKLKNIQAYYGKSLIDTYRSEKAIVGTGLYVDRRLERFNRIFRFRPFSDLYQFVYLTHSMTRLTPSLTEVPPGFEVLTDPDPDFPMSREVFEFHDPQVLFIYLEIQHLAEVHRLMNNHPDQAVRAKHLATWNMYLQGYPKLVKSLVDHDFSPLGIADIDWTRAKEHFEDSRG